MPMVHPRQPTRSLLVAVASVTRFKEPMQSGLEACRRTGVPEESYPSRLCARDPYSRHQFPEFAESAVARGLVR